MTSAIFLDVETPPTPAQVTFGDDVIHVPGALKKQCSRVARREPTKDSSNAGRRGVAGLRLESLETCPPESAPDARTPVSEAVSG